MKKCPIELVKLMKLLYDLTQTEAEIFSFMCGNKLTVKKLSALTMKERSVVQKILQKLYELNLVKRIKVGKEFYYSLEDTRKVKKILNERLREEIKRLRRVIETL